MESKYNIIIYKDYEEGIISYNRYQFINYAESTGYRRQRCAYW